MKKRKIRIGDVREQVLWNMINNTPGGSKKIAIYAVSCLPHASLKKLCEALDLEEEVKKLKKSI